MNQDLLMDGFQEIYCPGCKKRLPFQVFGLTVHILIRYQCRNCKRLLYVKEGLVPVVVRDAPAGKVGQLTD